MQNYQVRIGASTNLLAFVKFEAYIGYTMCCFLFVFVCRKIVLSLVTSAIFGSLIPGAD